MKDHYLNSVLELLASEALNTEGPHLITVDELRAAGALDVPPEWRKSLSAGCPKPVKRNLFSDLDEDDDFHREEPTSSSSLVWTAFFAPVLALALLPRLLPNLTVEAGTTFAAALTGSREHAVVIKNAAPATIEAARREPAFMDSPPGPQPN